MNNEWSRVSEIHTIVRVSFLLRLLLLLVSLLGFVGDSLSVGGAVAAVLLSATSLMGLWFKRAPQVLQQHPTLVTLDSIVMTGLMFALGTDNPLVLVTLSTCVVVGVLLPPVLASLSAITIVAGYLLASFSDSSEATTFISGFGLPIAFVAVVVLSHAFRLVAERKRQSERAMADLVTGAAAAQERARLARELHDSTAKTLQGIALSARSLSHWIDRDPQRAITESGAIADDSEEAIVRLRHLLASLRQDDHEQPFHESLAALARDAVEGHDVLLQLEVRPVPISAPDTRYELLAATREALINAVAHSGTEKITVAAHRNGEEITVEIRDNGCGFDAAILPERERDGHFGIRGYRERLELIGGRAEVFNEPGRGVKVLLHAPLMGLREGFHD